MGLFDKIFGNKNEKNIVAMTTSLFSNSVCCAQLNNVHPDLQKLLWISDGPHKNYSIREKKEFYECCGVKIPYFSYSQQEPSLMSTKMPINLNVDPECVDALPYFPTYAGLSPEQRGVYWKFLSNPYVGGFEIGYIFILYYGLERHLLEGDYKAAFDVILKLRDVYDNASFQSYSACAIILTCLIRQDSEMAISFYQSLDKSFEFNFSHNLYLLCKLGLHQPLTAIDIMRMARTFEFTNQNYIKKYPELFIEKLCDVMQNKLGCRELDISRYITRTEYKKLRRQNTPVFANLSIGDKVVPIPQFVECFKLKKAVYDLLEDAHFSVKNELADMRKKGGVPKVKKKENAKTITILTFDVNGEQELLEAYAQSRTNAMTRHFVLIQMQNFYYKYRDIDSKYLDLCIAYCNEDISLLPEIQKQHNLDERTMIDQMKGIYSKDRIAEEYRNIRPFVGDIPAFKRLAIIYEKQKKYDEAIGVCHRAIEYYRNIGLYEDASDFQNRVQKLEGKIQKTNKT